MSRDSDLKARLTRTNPVPRVSLSARDEERAQALFEHLVSTPIEGEQQRRPKGRLVLVAVALVGVLLVALATAFRPPDRDAYVARNEAILEQLPVFPGATQIRETNHRAEKAGDLPLAPVVGYSSSRGYATPAHVSRTEVIEFYREQLRESGWRLVAESEARALSFSKDDAYLHVVTGPRQFYVSVDHEFCEREARWCVPPEERWRSAGG